ncbi:hypothetical protein X971_4005 [Agrobacterium tumefaciens LBA4213 (Ach5)]|nr:hypothetical protein X971_4005 [Agrobacterium tumefaciens LBA4213 (Ach5)]
MSGPILKAAPMVSATPHRRSSPPASRNRMLVCPQLQM